MSEISLNTESFDSIVIEKEEEKLKYTQLNNHKLSSVDFRTNAFLTVIGGPLGLNDFHAGNYKLAALKIGALILPPLMLPIWISSTVYLARGDCKDSNGKPIRLATQIPPKDLSQKDQQITLLFAMLTGCFGGHQFYAGNPFKGVAMLCTCGGLGFWILHDMYKIVTAQFKDGQGKIIAPDYLKATPLIR